MKKICTYCGLERDTEKDFNWEYKTRGIRQRRCKYYQSEMSKLHYQNNKQTYNTRSSARKMPVMAENASCISAYLSTHPCVDCNQTDVRLSNLTMCLGKNPMKYPIFLLGVLVGRS